ncbi:hypothetical protein KCU65_g151, partial [Aureobasidium melanogenum]
MGRTRTEHVVEKVGSRKSIACIGQCGPRITHPPSTCRQSVSTSTTFLMRLARRYIMPYDPASISQETLLTISGPKLPPPNLHVQTPFASSLGGSRCAFAWFSEQSPPFLSSLSRTMSISLSSACLSAAMSDFSPSLATISIFIAYFVPPRHSIGPPPPLPSTDVSH